MTENTVDEIKKQLEENDLLVYMKGTPYNPQCGFSAKVMQCLIEVGKEFAFVNILENPEIRSTLPSVSDWPTFPQVFVKGELIGGCDIVTEMHSTGELKELLYDE